MAWTTAATTTLRLDYPLYQGTAGFPKAIADWILQQQGLINFLDKLVHIHLAHTLMGQTHSLVTILAFASQILGSSSDVNSTDAENLLADGGMQLAGRLVLPEYDFFSLHLTSCVHALWY